MILTGLGLAALVVTVAMTITAYAARRTGHWAVVDVTWGLGFAAIGLANLAARPGPRSVLLAVLVVLWGGRLGAHLRRRASGLGEDPRYVALKKRHPKMVTAVLLPQGAAMWLVALPLTVPVWQEQARLGWMAWVGVAVWLVGIAFEAVGDAQLSAYRADPGRGPVLDTGLWRYTRHPNYFGDACVWWGLWLVAADHGWISAATIISPIVMTLLLRYGTGAALLEKSMMKRPGYPEYAARTSMFFPRRPVSSAKTR